MCVQRIPLAILVVSLGTLLFGLACSGAKPAATPTASGTGVENATVQTPSYRIELLIGPVQTIMGLEMSMTDQGYPVNRHLEIHVYQRSSGAALEDALPTVKIKNATTGASRELTNVIKCFPPFDHGAGPHYGNNLYLPDGKYSITVAVGNESVSFDVSL